MNQTTPFPRPQKPQFFSAFLCRYVSCRLARLAVVRSRRAAEPIQRRLNHRILSRQQHACVTIITIAIQSASADFKSKALPEKQKKQSSPGQVHPTARSLASHHVLPVQLYAGVQLVSNASETKTERHLNSDSRGKRAATLGESSNTRSAIAFRNRQTHKI
jgi:hypothetical protein